MSLPFLWEFPGGKVEDGEDPPAALRRELKEELAVDALIGDLVGRVTIALLADTESSICLRLFRACFEGEVRLSEHSSLGWFTVDELKCLAMPAADRVLLPSVCGWMSPPV